MENNSDRMGFALIALSVVAFVLFAVNGTLQPTVKGFFNGFKNWQTQTFDGITESNKKDVIHTAYSWSEDGVDRFTTTKPNLNLLLDSQNQVKSGEWYTTNGEWTEGWGTYLGSKIYRTKYEWSNARYSYKDLLDRGVINTTDDFTYSIYFRVVGEDPVGMSYANIKFISEATTKHASIPVQLTSLKEGQWTRIVVTFKFNGTKYNPVYPWSHTLRVEASAVTKVKGAYYEYAAPKLELGSIATPYMPSASEVKPSDQPKYIGTYTDKSESASQEPSKYTWKLNPDYHA